MKLIHDQNRIIGTASDEYSGPMPWVPAPDGFQPDRMSEYRIEAGQAVIPLLDIATLVQRKKEALDEKTNTLFQQAVTLPDGSVWRGGEGSALSIKGAVELAEFAGITEITLRDAERRPHLKTLEEARAIAAAIGLDYQLKFQAKEDALLALSEIDIDADDAVAQIEGIDITL